VIASTGARAETLSKSGFLRETIPYLEWLPTVGAAGLVIDDDGVATASGNWETYR
jgi:thiamine biosynthesis lipoprotein